MGTALNPVFNLAYCRIVEVNQLEDGVDLFGNARQVKACAVVHGVFTNADQGPGPEVVKISHGGQIRRDRRGFETLDLLIDTGQHLGCAAGIEAAFQVDRGSPIVVAEMVRSAVWWIGPGHG